MRISWDRQMSGREFVHEVQMISEHRLANLRESVAFPVWYLWRVNVFIFSELRNNYLKAEHKWQYLGLVLYYWIFWLNIDYSLLKRIWLISFWYYQRRLLWNRGILRSTLIDVSNIPAEKSLRWIIFEPSFHDDEVYELFNWFNNLKLNNLMMIMQEITNNHS